MILVPKMSHEEEIKDTIDARDEDALTRIISNGPEEINNFIDEVHQPYINANSAVIPLLSMPQRKAGCGELEGYLKLVQILIIAIR